MTILSKILPISQLAPMLDRLANILQYSGDVATTDLVTLTGDGLNPGVCLVVSTTSSYETIANAQRFVSDNYHSSHPLFVMFFNF